MSAERKDEHIRLAMEQQDRGFAPSDLDAVRFVHHALAGGIVASVDLSTRLLGAAWPVPVFINGMTGGSPRAAEINAGLGAAAAATGVPIATGSMSAFFKDPAQAESYAVIRERAPEAFVLANLNAEASASQLRSAVDLIGADAVQIHINAVQETAMPEGDRAFAHWPERIAELAESSPVPVVVKEVGFGLSRATLEQLRELGITTADVAGRGGTDFARIENDRRRLGEFAYLSGWGQSAPESLIEAAGLEGIELIGSGGIRHPLDVVRCLALGARAVGVSGHFLQVLVNGGVDALVEEITGWTEQLRQLMALLGADTVEELQHTDLLIGGELRERLELRGIEVSAWARRRKGRA